MSLDDGQESHEMSMEESVAETSVNPYGTRFQEIKVTMAYEDGLTKTRCGLCKMYFHKSTVFCKVPNHRILELQTKWKCIKVGRRYQSASFLYNMTEVCLFCSQLFAEVPGEEKRPPTRDNNKSADLEHKLEITTKVERSDIACNKRAYQSSEVDERGAFLAITPPHSQVCKTRREADPWWEIDFGRPYHVHSISFYISSAIRLQLHASIMLLDKPLGFEDPFLDSVSKKAIKKREFNVNESDRIVMEHIYWELPINTKCSSIRIQLKGINFLAIQKFQAFQGDDLVNITDDDLEKTRQSYASLGPQEMKDALYEMMSPSKKKQLIREKIPVFEKPIDVHNYDLTMVNKMSVHIRDRYGTLDSWKRRVTTHASMFPIDDINAMNRIIFKYVCDMNFNNKDHPLPDYDLMGSGLILHFPRCDLGELHQRIRSVVRWIQTRTHLKALGALLNSPNFVMVADNPNDHLYHLLTAFKRVEFFWNKTEESEKSRAQHNTSAALDALASHKTVPQPGNVSEARGCSWSQFLMVMALFCTNQCHRIPELAFNIDDGKVHAQPVISSPTMDVNATDSQELPTFSMSVSLDGKSVSSGNNSNNGNNNQRVGFAAGRNSAWLKKLSTAKVLNGYQLAARQQTIQEKIGRLEYEYNPSFGEYKYAKFKKRIERDPVFPKTLSLEFAKTLIPKRGQTSHGREPTLTAEQIAALQAQQAAEGEGGDDGTRSEGQSSLETEYRHHTGGITPVTPKNSGPVRATMAFPPLNLSRPNSSSNLRAETPPTAGLSRSASMTPGALVRQSTLTPGALQRQSTMTPGKLNRTSSVVSVRGLTVDTMPTTPAGAAAATSAAFAPATPSRHQVTIASEEDFEDFSFSGSSKQDESENGNHDSPRKQDKVDFYKICALCELRLPRSSMEIKVFRKHVVKLRSSWDPKLVSKEIRSLDNTISMYNLVDVCLFCSQYFDPDFPDGIAYPVKIQYNVKSSIGAVNAINSQEPGSSKFIPFYDMRHKNNDVEVGQMFRRPATVESRQRAKRATEIVQEHERKLANFLANSV